MTSAAGSRMNVWQRAALVWSAALAMAAQCKPTPPAPESTCWDHATVSRKSTCRGADSEPNDDVPFAQVMPSPLCDDVPVTGSASEGDVDWFHAHGDGCATGVPHLRLGTERIRACLFVQCSTGSTGVSSEATAKFCSDGSAALRHPSGLLGCCLSKPGTVDINVACSTTKRTLDSFVVVDGTVDECTPYDVTFHL